MPDVVICETINDSALKTLRADFQLHYDASLVERREELCALLSDARALIVRNRTRVDDELLASARRLRVVGRLGVGLDNIDLDACRRREVEVVPATGANTASVAEYVIAAVLMLLRGAYQCSQEVLAGEWPRERYIGRESSAKTLGLIGFGDIARATATRARALEMHVLACDPFVAADDPAWAQHGTERASLDTVLAASDAVSLHVPLTPDTRYLIGRAQLSRMRAGSVLVNTARGGVLDEAALADALRSGHLGGAMLDVFEHEPLPAESPLAGVPRLVVTPHIAGLTAESNERVGALIAARVREILLEAAP